MPEKAGMDRDEVFFFCLICNTKLTLDSKYYEEDDYIYCKECWDKQDKEA